MSVAPIDLSALDAFETFGPARTEGKPLLLDIDLLHEDPNQPRKSFDDMADITAAVERSCVARCAGTAERVKNDARLAAWTGAWRGI